MKVDIKYYGRDLVFQANAANGYPLLVGQSFDGKIKTFRPMELLLTGLASCSSVDVVKILTKQKQSISDYSVQINGNRSETSIPAVFETISIDFILAGDINPQKAKRAVSLAVEKYCSIAKMIEETVDINYKVILNQEEI